MRTAVGAQAVAGAFVTCASLSLGGCSLNEPDYLPSPVPIEIGGGAMGEPSAVMELLFRPPTVAERAELDNESGRRGFSVPWLRTDNVAISLLYTITNLGTAPAEARLEIDGSSEFATYDVVALRAAQAMAPPGQEDETEYLSLLGAPPVILEPGAHLSGTVDEEAFAEAALDLDALGRWGAVPAAVILNSSRQSPNGLERVPANHVRPAFFRVRVGLIGSGHLRLNWIVRVRDEAGQLMLDGGTPFAPTPTAYAPMMPAMP